MNLQNIRYIVCLIIEFLSSALTLEGVKACLIDQRGGLVLPIDGIEIEDYDWIKYKSLKKDKSLKAINYSDLPSDFCEKACDLVDEFRRKTVNENVEWMLYFDYTTGETVYCWEGEEDKCGGIYDKKYFKDRHIASIHSHPKGYYSFPSPANFDILENDFEDYEIITSLNACWLVEFKGSVEYKLKETFQDNYLIELNKIDMYNKLNYRDAVILKNMNEYLTGEYLLNGIDKKINNIDLIFSKVRLQYV